jgi:transcriptional regulator with XRE-family HTH domain
MERNICLHWSELVEEAVKRRKQQRLTQKQLAIRVGISAPTLTSFEQGKTTITLISVIKILQALELTPVQSIHHEYNG